MPRCLGEDVQADLLDRAPFKCIHRLLGHPSLELDHLAKVIPTLPEGQVMYSRSLLSNGDDFEGTSATSRRGSASSRPSRHCATPTPTSWSVRRSRIPVCASSIRI